MVHGWLFATCLRFLIGFAMMFWEKMSAQNKAHLAGFLRMGGRFMNDLSGMNTLVMYNAADRYAKKVRR